MISMLPDDAPRIAIQQEVVNWPSPCESGKDTVMSRAHATMVGLRHEMARCFFITREACGLKESITSSLRAIDRTRRRLCLALAGVACL